MQKFCPVLWEEEAVPKKERNCKECGLFEHGSRMVWGEGNPGAPIMVILDNPGMREDKEGKQFVCGTRKTLQEAANSVGLNQQDLYITYILKRRPIKKYDKDRTRQICMRHLDQQLHEKQPSHIICLGNVAVQHFFQSDGVDVKSLRGDIHHKRGYPVTVAYHPLAVRRRPNLHKLFLEDWRLAAHHYKGNVQEVSD